MDDLNKKYLIDLHQHQNSSIEVLREFAEVNEVPIVDRLTLDLIKQLIRMNNVKNILEIGTAIGYSSMQFASISDDIHVTTIERNETMIQYAKQNLATYHFENQVRIIEGNALEQFENVNDKVYDMIFIDAAKAQSKKFFEIYTPLLKHQGLVITDNVLYHGFVSDIGIVRSRNVRQMVKKVQDYNEWLISNQDIQRIFKYRRWISDFN